MKRERKLIRVYADTSVFGGVFDEEFRRASTGFFQRVRVGDLILVTSEPVRREIEGAPELVRHLFEEMLVRAEVVTVDEKALSLQEQYVAAGIVPDDYATDALHVALATISNSAMIVSWNFRHIVHYEKIPLYCAVNVLNGYGAIAIHSPLEVVSDENEDV